MAKATRQFDRNKYLNDPRGVTPAQAARVEAARERWLRMRPLVFWPRAAAGLAVTVLVGAALGWLFDWSMLRTGTWIAVATIVSVASNLLAFRSYMRRRRSL